mgnify:CR=1 FL=1
MAWRYPQTAFADRHEAGRRLAWRLRPLAGERPVVLALPRGGVPVAFEVAAALHAPLDLVLVRKLGAPGNPELAVGAVVDGETPCCLLNEELVRALGVPDAYLAAEQARQLAEIERRRSLYLGDRPRPSLTGRTVILVDDGIATGATMKAALAAARQAGAARLVVATPVAPADTLAELRELADMVVVLMTPAGFAAVGQFYEDFTQIEDGMVIDLLRRANPQHGGSADAGQERGDRS